MITYLTIVASAFAIIVLLGLYSKHHNRFFNAVSRGQIELVKEMLAARPELAQQTDAIVWAALFNQRAVCESLLRHGCDIGEKAARVLRSAVSHPELLQFLLDKGLDANAPSDNAPTLLHIAAMLGNLDSVRTLMDHGANVEADFEPWDATPLACAARCGHVELVNFLLSSGANPMSVDITQRLRQFQGPRVEADRLRACEQSIRAAQQSRST